MQSGGSLSVGGRYFDCVLPNLLFSGRPSKYAGSGLELSAFGQGLLIIAQRLAQRAFRRYCQAERFSRLNLLFLHCFKTGFTSAGSRKWDPEALALGNVVPEGIIARDRGSGTAHQRHVADVETDVAPVRGRSVQNLIGGISHSVMVYINKFSLERLGIDRLGHEYGDFILRHKPFRKIGDGPSIRFFCGKFSQFSSIIEIGVDIFPVLDRINAYKSLEGEQVVHSILYSIIRRVDNIVAAPIGQAHLDRLHRLTRGNLLSICPHYRRLFQAGDKPGAVIGFQYSRKERVQVGAASLSD